MAAGPHAVPVHGQRGIDAVEISDVHRDQGVQERFIRKLHCDAPPEPPHERAVHRVVGDADVELVERHRGRGAGRAGARQRLRIVRQVSYTVLRAGERGRERHGRRGQHPAVLIRIDSAGRRGAPVVGRLHAIRHALARVATTQELQVHVGRCAIRLDGPACGGQALRRKQATVGPLAGRPRSGAGPAFRGVRQAEQPKQHAHFAVDPVATVPDSASAVMASPLSPKWSVSTATVSSPSAGAI